MLTGPLDADGRDAAHGEVLSFHEAVAVVADGRGRLTSAELSALSDPQANDVSTFAERWPGVDRARRRDIAAELVGAAETSFQYRFERLFEVLLDDDEADVRAAAVEGLWEDERPALATRFLALMRSDDSPDVRAHAAEALGNYVYRGELGEVDDALSAPMVTALIRVAWDESEDQLVRRRALESAGYADREDAQLLIESMFESAVSDMREGAVVAMGRSADERWARDVVDSLQSPEPALRYEAALAAGKLGLKETVPLLEGFTHGDDREIQLAAIWSLGEIGGRRAKRTLAALVADPDDELVAEAAEEALATAQLLGGDLEL